MKETLYITGSGRLSRKDRTLRFDRDGDDRPRYVPIERIQDILIFGEVELNKRFLEFMTQHLIPIHFFNRYGHYVGTYYPREHYSSGYLLLQQVTHYLNENLRLTLARKFVEGSLFHLLQVLRYYIRRGHSAIEPLAKEIAGHQARLGELTRVPQLMQAEGQAWEVYYRAMDAILDGTEFAFVRRSRRPPHNALNALISFVNTLLYTAILTEIYKTHLDPRIGYLHETNFRRFTLHLDVAEVFKPILAERLVISLVQKKQIQSKHFTATLGGIYLTEEGRNIVLQAWEERMKATFYHRMLKRNVSYRRILRLELYKLEKHFLGDAEYVPFRSRW
ncbi:MAG: type I-B CRISPR-associated endonuclease Cas1 [Brockia lithotrophica]|nr:type I-B CRISPR-associated endonuclease Cas1 [Brockia lithotrophica]